ncbi:DUF4817 domain-containing protein [Trichonephila clavipes]|nr:DUF4817 domain-containing protein [Trichonephila clavipes]
MLSAPDKALLVKLFYMNEESATIALRKFRVQKNVKSGKSPLTPAGLLKFVKRFEETGKLEDRARAGRPCLKEARVPCIAVEMEAIASEAASGTNSAREAARRLGLPPSSVRNILRRILQLYPYKLQSCHELLPADTAQREAFAKWAFSKMEQDISRFMVTLTMTVPFGRPLIHCPVNGWITEAVNAQRYLTLLRETVVKCLIQRGQIANVTYMQDGATSHTANPVKAFLIQTFGEDRIVSRRWRYPWPPRFPDLTPADFWFDTRASAALADPTRALQGTNRGSGATMEEYENDVGILVQLLLYADKHYLAGKLPWETIYERFYMGSKNIINVTLAH